MTMTEPVYLRVLDDLRTRIRTGLLPPGARVPSRNAIITRYGVGETAAKHALRVLAAEGLIEARPGSGSFVRGVPLVLLLEHDRPHFPGSPFAVQRPAPPDGQDGHGGAGAWRLGREHQTEQAVPPRQVARRLGLPAGAAATVTRYLFSCDGQPVQLAVSYEPSELTAGTPVAAPEEGPLAGRGVAERMRSIGITIAEVIEEITVRAAARPEAEALALAAGAKVLSVERTHLAGSRVVEISEIVIPAERCALRYRFPAPAAAR
jgi:GntR family transcriptional regulator